MTMFSLDANQVLGVRGNCSAPWFAFLREVLFLHSQIYISEEERALANDDMITGTSFI